MTGGAARASLVLLAVATACGAGAWRLQAEAGELLKQAVAVQEAEVPEEGGSSPSLEEYQDVVEALEESIALRSRIDALLSRVEELTSALGRQQQEAAAVTAEAESRLDEIGGILGAARTEARRSGEQLTVLLESLGRTPRLARLIAEELEELDRSLGPSVGRSP